MSTKSLSGLELLGLPKADGSSRIIAIIRTGISKESLEYFRKVTGFSIHILATAMSVDEQTIRRKKPTEKFNDTSSERLLNLADLTARGQRVFGSLDKFISWMNTPVRPLAKQKPIDLIDTNYGLGLVSDEIGRIEYGVYA